MVSGINYLIGFYAIKPSKKSCDVIVAAVHYCDTAAIWKHCPALVMPHCTLQFHCARMGMASVVFCTQAEIQPVNHFLFTKTRLRKDVITAKKHLLF